MKILVASSYIITHIEMIDCIESDSMVEIYGKLDKWNT